MCAECERMALLAYMQMRMELGVNPDDLVEAFQNVVMYHIEDEIEPTHADAGTA